jgi:hypothetical protein
MGGADGYFHVVAGVLAFDGDAHRRRMHNSEEKAAGPVIRGLFFLSASTSTGAPEKGGPHGSSEARQEAQEGASDEGGARALT